MTTFQQWVDAFRNLSITGVTRHYDEPPLSLNTANLPAAWPSMFSGGYDGQQWSCDELNQNFSMTYVIACEAANQSRIPENYELMVDIADATRTAINAITATTFIRPIRIASARVVISDNAYYGLVCEVEGNNGGL